MDLIIKVAISGGIIVVFYYYTNYWGQRRAESGVVTVFEILKTFTFLLAFSTSQILLHPIVNTNLSGLQLSGIWLTLVTSLIATTLGLVVDVGVNLIWPYVFSAYQQSKWKRKTAILVHVLTVVVVILSGLTIGFSYFSPLFLPDIKAEDTRDVAEVVAGYQADVVGASYRNLNTSINKLNNKLDDIDAEIAKTWPVYYGRYVDNVQPDDYRTKYVDWMANKRNEAAKKQGESWDEIKTRIAELENKVADLASSASTTSEELTAEVLEENRKARLTNESRTLATKQITRYLGGGSTVLEIICIYVLVLLGTYGDKYEELCKISVRPGAVRVSSRPSTLGTSYSFPLPSDEEEEVVEVETRWDKQENQAEYLHTFKGGPKTGEREWKNKDWVRNQLYQNRSRSKEAGASSTYAQNVEFFSTVIDQLEELEKLHV